MTDQDPLDLGESIVGATPTEQDTAQDSLDLGESVVGSTVTPQQPEENPFDFGEPISTAPAAPAPNPVIKSMTMSTMTNAERLKMNRDIRIAEQYRKGYRPPEEVKNDWQYGRTTDVPQPEQTPSQDQNIPEEPLELLAAKTAATVPPRVGVGLLRGAGGLVYAAGSKLAEFMTQWSANERKYAYMLPEKQRLAAEQAPVGKLEAFHTALKEEPNPYNQPTWIEEGSRKLQEELLERNVKEIGVNGAMATDFALNLADTALTIAAYVKATPAGKIVPEARGAVLGAASRMANEGAKAAATAFALTPGGPEEREKSAKQMAGLAMIPAGLAGITSKTLQAIAGVAGLNIWSLPEYYEANQRAEEQQEKYGGDINAWRAKEISVLAVMNTLFGLHTPAARLLQERVLADVSAKDPTLAATLRSKAAQLQMPTTEGVAKGIEFEGVPQPGEPRPEITTQRGTAEDAANYERTRYLEERQQLGLPPEERAAKVADIAQETRTPEELRNYLYQQGVPANRLARMKPAELAAMAADANAIRDAVPPAKREQVQPPTLIEPPPSPPPARVEPQQPPAAPGGEPVAKPISKRVAEAKRAAQPPISAEATTPQAEPQPRETAPISKPVQATAEPVAKSVAGRVAEAKEKKAKSAVKVETAPEAKSAKSVEQAVEAGEPVTIPRDPGSGKPYPKVRVTFADKKYNPVVMNSSDLDTVKGQKIAGVEFGRGAGNKMFKPAEGEGRFQNIAAAAEQAKKSGSTAFFDSELWNERATKFKRWLSRQGMSGGLTPEARKMAREKTGASSANTMEANIVRDELVKGRKPLDKKFGDQAVSGFIFDVWNNIRTPAQFAKQFGLGAGDRIVRALDAALILRKSYRIELSKAIAANNPELARKILDNMEYEHTFYQIHFDPTYQPTAKARRNAVNMRLAELDEAIDTTMRPVVKAVSKLKNKVRADVAGFMETGDTSLLADMKPRQRAAFERVREATQQFKRFADMVQDADGTLTVKRNQEALNDAARSYVNELLDEQRRGTGRIGMASGSREAGALKSLTLDNPVLKALFGEVTDPVERMARTLEIQGRLLPTLTLQNRMFAAGENKFWTNERSDMLGTTVHLPKSVGLGTMGGKWVKPEIAAELAPTRHNLALQVWMKGIGVQRGMQLLNPGSWVRDYMSNVGYALAADNVKSLEYARNFAMANKLMARWAAGDVAARRQVEEFVRLGVWDHRTSGMLAEVEQLVSANPAVGLRGKLGKAFTARGSADFAFKVASYLTKRKETGSHDAALKHVRSFFQYYDENPKFLKWASAIPLVKDYPNFRVGAMRIAMNQMIRAVQEGKKGNLVPALKMTAAHGFSLASGAAITTGIAALRQQIGNGIQKVTGNKVDMDDTEKQTAMRRFLLPQWGNAPIVSWQETLPDGSKRRRYAVAANLSAYPTDETMYGILQRDDLGATDKVIELLKQTARDNFGASMALGTAYEVLTGDQLGSLVNRKGFTDIGYKDPDLGKIAVNAMSAGIGQPFGGQMYRRARAVARGTMEPTEAITSVLFGTPRIYTVDRDFAIMLLQGALRKQTERLESYGKTIDYAKKNNPDNPEAAQLDADRGNIGRRQVLKEMNDDIKAFRTAFGDMVNNADIQNTILEMRLPLRKAEKLAALHGTTPPTEPAGGYPKRTTSNSLELENPGGDMDIPVPRP